jgi:hypothetical protein
LRILLDECVPRALRRSLSNFPVVTTVPDAGLAGLTNGNLLRSASGAFDVFITVDKSIRYQQNLASFNLAFVLLRARSNDIADIAPLVPKFLARLSELRAGQLLVIE